MNNDEASRNEENDRTDSDEKEDSNAELNANNLSKDEEKSATDDGGVDMLPQEEEIEGENEEEEDNVIPIGEVAEEDVGIVVPVSNLKSRLFHRLHYTQTSLLAASMLLWYTLRTRREFYPTVLYLSSSKLSYCVFGNAICAIALSIYSLVVRIFLGGLRVAEREAIRDGMRWSMTETCLALTMFREEVSVDMGGMFLILIMVKCWHWALELRGKHLIQTEDAIELNSGRIRIPFSHIKYVMMMIALFCGDISALIYCIWYCIDNGPSIHILFGFEAMILAISVSTVLHLYTLHFIDGLVGITSHAWPANKFLHRIASFWRDYKLTLTLSLDLVSYSAKFLSYLLFFFIVFTYYGMPINIFREVYMSFQELRKKMVQFASYRRLSAMMDTKFHTCTTNEELEAAGRVCIICRDTLLLSDKPKRLPGCGHVFHKYCLKGWLMQQNTCPTCRADITLAVKEEERLASVAALEQNTNTDATSTEQTTSRTTSNNGDDTTLTSFVQNTSDENNHESSELSSKTLSLPCLYKVGNLMGANITKSPGFLSHVRVVPYNRIILCTEEKILKENGISQRFLLMPDGWVKEENLIPVLSISLPKDTTTNIKRNVINENLNA